MTTQFSKKILLKAIYYGGPSVIEECKSNSQGKRTKSERGREGMMWLSTCPVQATLRSPSPAVGQ